MTPEKYNKLFDLEARAESQMRRAFKRWEKARAARRRAEQILDRQFIVRAATAEQLPPYNDQL